MNTFRAFASQVLVAFLQVTVASAAVPARTPPSECRDRRVVEAGSPLLAAAAEQASWDCLDLSRLGKTELMAAADKAPDLKIDLSKSLLSRNDFIDLSNAANDKFLLAIDSARFNRVDVIAMRRANVKMLVLSAGASLNSNDLTEISAGDGEPVTVEVNGPTFTVDELRTLTKQPNLKFVIDVAKAGITEDEARSIATDVPETKLNF